MPEINHHSQRVSALLGKPPGWLLRWGTAVIFLVVAAVLLGAAFVRYPDVISAPITITGTNPPQVLLAQTNGRFAAFYHRDGDTVKAGDVLGVLESQAQPSHIFTLDSLLQTFSVLLNPSDSALPDQYWPDFQLGAAQTAYGQFRLAYADVNQFLQQKAYAMQRAALEDQIVNLGMYYKRSWQQRQTLQAQYDLAQQRYYSDSLLAADGVYAPQELSKRKEQLLQLQYSLHGARAALAQTKVQMADLDKSLAELTLTFQREAENKRLVLDAALAELTTRLDEWRYTFAFTTEIDGRIEYQTVWAENQNVSSGTHVFTIKPTGTYTVKAQMLVPPQRLAKVGARQRVQVKLDAYPFEEFGMLIGTVEKLNGTPIPVADGQIAYVATVQLPHNLETTYGYQLTDFDQLTGTAEIITEELSLLERIFYSLRKLL